MAALGQLLSGEAGYAASEGTSGGVLKSLHYPARAKRVIYLFMSGGPSQIDLLDHKPELTKRDRSLVTISVLTALSRTDELRGHMKRALENGVTQDEIRGMITHLAFYAGWPCAVNAGRIAAEVFEDD